MTDRTRTPWYHMPVGGDSPVARPSEEKLKIGEVKRKVEMIGEIQEIGEKMKEVWEE